MRTRSDRLLDGVTKTLTVAWIIWVSNTLVQLKANIAGLTKTECVGDLLKTGPKLEVDEPSFQMACPLISPLPFFSHRKETSP